MNTIENINIFSYSLLEATHETSFLATLIVLSSALILYLLSQRKYVTQFPSPKGLPLLGHVFQINLFRYTDTFDDGHKQLGDNVEYSFAHFKYIDSVDPAIVTQVIHATERDDLYKYSLSDVFGKRSVILTSGDRWKTQRKVLTPTLSAHHLHHLFSQNPQFLKFPSQSLVRRLHCIAGNGKAYEMDTELSRVSLAVVGNAIFGHDFGYCKSKIDDFDNPFLVELWNGLAEFNKRLSNPLRKYLNPYAIWRFHKTLSTVKKTVKYMIQERVAKGNLNEQGEKLTDAMGVLLDAAEMGKVDGVDFNYDDVMENVVTLLLAGHETTAHTMAFILYEVAQHPEVESRLIDELDRFGRDRPIKYEDFSSGELSYLSKVVNEVLRLHPVAPSIIRAWHTGQLLGSTTAARDYSVGVTLTSLHMDPKIWPDPHLFNPDRFDEECTSRSVTSYLPFGGGPRTCLGKKLALLEMKYMIANLYKNFTFKLVPGFKYDIEITVTMHEIHSMPLLVEPRTPYCTSDSIES